MSTAAGESTAAGRQASLADVLIRAGRIYSLRGDGAVHRSLAIRRDRVVAVGDAPESLDELIGPGTRVIEEPGWTLLPGFTDTHTHLIFAGRAIRDVAIERATTLGELLGLIGERAAVTPAGEWIRTNSAWHELNLAERRFPTRWELDQVAPDNAVLIKRGGHNDVCNSLALKLGGIDRETPDPPGGKVFRDAAGEPTGLLQETPAFASVEAAMPPPSFEEQMENLALASEDYARKGLCAVRDCAVEPRGEIELLQAVHDRGRLAVRTRYLILATAVGSVQERIALLDALKVRSDTGDAMLRVWGLKAILDGRAEGGATCEPYRNDPDEHGILIWNADELAQLADYALKNGWRLGTHAVGDRAVRVTLEAYERALAANPDTPPGSLVIEHGFLVGPEQRARAIRLGIPITVQHPLLFTLAAELVQNWGNERASQVMPVSEWLREGALLGAGSDYPVGPYDAMRSVWGMVTRETGGAGVLGPEHAIDRETAIGLYTTEAVQLLGEQDERGTLEPGKLADFVAYSTDPFTCELDQLAELEPTLTVVGGRRTWDPQGRLG
jgi:predicted amidohydrolase YtcJ